jgi:hypothetical protein
MVPALLLFAMLSGDAAWKDYSDWFIREGRPGAPADVLKAYGGKLKASGLGAVEAEAYMKKVQESLKPGGMLLVEGFGSGRGLEPNTILKAFLDYRVLVYEELPDVADWGKMKAPLLRLALVKR